MAKKDKEAQKSKEIDKETPQVEQKEEKAVTKHSAVINGKQVKYTVTTGTIILNDPKKEYKQKASVFFTAYTRDGVRNRSTRPLTFAFNGGPGSSSVWLHLGALGPRRVKMKPDGSPLPPPYELINNEYSILDITDLVFIDPVSTGFSRAVKGEKPDDFHGFTGDIESVGDFIRLYTTRYKRWSSPKFLAGESYGTTRAAGLSGYLQDDLGMYLNGIILISSILNFQTARFTPGNDMPYILFLPTYTATAWYHKKLPKVLQGNLEKALSEAETFASTEYTLALMKGNNLSAREHKTIVEKLARLTGLSEDFIDQSNLRVPIFRFVKELLRDRRRTVGRFDSRFMGKDRDAAGEKFDYDPSYATIQGVYTAMLNDYVRRDLNFESDLSYQILTGRVHPWKFDKHQNVYVNVAETLRQAITRNPFLKVFIANGYYDLATPYYATHYTVNHMELDKELQKNVSMGHYEAGHMMYARETELAKLKDDLKTFIEAAIQS